MIDSRIALGFNPTTAIQSPFDLAGGFEQIQGQRGQNALMNQRFRQGESEIAKQADIRGIYQGMDQPPTGTAPPLPAPPPGAPPAPPPQINSDPSARMRSVSARMWKAGYRDEAKVIDDMLMAQDKAAQEKSKTDMSIGKDRQTQVAQTAFSLAQGFDDDVARGVPPEQAQQRAQEKTNFAFKLLSDHGILDMSKIPEDFKTFNRDTFASVGKGGAPVSDQMKQNDPNKPFFGNGLPNVPYQEYADRNAKSGASQVIVNPANDPFKNTASLRKEYQDMPQIKAAAEMNSAFRIIETAYARPSAANDLAMATKYMKILDPTSVVRESELAMAMNATGVMDRVFNYAEMIKSGQKLNPAQRKDFYDSAKAINGAFQAEAQRTSGHFKSIASKYGLPEEEITFGTDFAKPSAAPAPKKASALKIGDRDGDAILVKGTGVNQEDWKYSPLPKNGAGAGAAAPAPAPKKASALKIGDRDGDNILVKGTGVNQEDWKYSPLPKKASALKIGDRRGDAVLVKGKGLKPEDWKYSPLPKNGYDGNYSPYKAKGASKPERSSGIPPAVPGVTPASTIPAATAQEAYDAAFRQAEPVGPNALRDKAARARREAESAQLVRPSTNAAAPPTRPMPPMQQPVSTPIPPVAPRGEVAPNIRGGVETSNLIGSESMISNPPPSGGGNPAVDALRQKMDQALDANDLKQYKVLRDELDSLGGPRPPREAPPPSPAASPNEFDERQGRVLEAEKLSEQADAFFKAGKYKEGNEALDRAKAIRTGKPKPGTVINGHVFLRGNAGDPKNWKRMRA